MSTSDASSPWGGLKVQCAGCELSSASQILVLLHGYGATGSDLVPLADVFGGEHRAFVFPQAPVSVDSGGFAWATNDEEFGASRLQLIGLFNYLSQSHPNASVSVGGFSQGATIASTLIAERRIKLQHVILYSAGLAIDGTLPKITNGPTVLVSHGKSDTVLPFSDAVRLKTILSDIGLKVNWFAFEGGHTVTDEIIQETRKQLDQ